MGFQTLNYFIISNAIFSPSCLPHRSGIFGNEQSERKKEGTEEQIRRSEDKSDYTEP